MVAAPKKPELFTPVQYDEEATQIAATNGYTADLDTQQAVFFKAVWGKLPLYYDKGKYAAQVSLFACGDGKTAATKHIAVEGLRIGFGKSLLGWADSLNEHNSIYYNVASRKSGVTKRGDADDLQSIGIMWCDLDCAKHDVTLEVAYHALMQWRYLPTFVIFSGGGLQAVWVLDGAVEVSTEVLAENFTAAMLRWIKPLFDTLPLPPDTGVMEAARMLRLPGFVNRKTDPDRGNNMARIIAHNPDAMVSWAEVQTAPEPAPAVKHEAQPLNAVRNAPPRKSAVTAGESGTRRRIHKPLAHFDGCHTDKLQYIASVPEHGNGEYAGRNEAANTLSFKLGSLAGAVILAGYSLPLENIAQSLVQAAQSTALPDKDNPCYRAFFEGVAKPTDEYEITPAQSATARTVDRATGEITLNDPSFKPDISGLSLEVDPATGEITSLSRDIEAPIDLPQALGEFSQYEDLPAPEMTSQAVTSGTLVSEVGTADGGDVWRGLPQWIAQYILDYAPSRQRNALLYALDDVISHAFQMGDPIVTAPKLYTDESDRRSFGRTAKDYGLGYLLQWAKNCLVVQSDSLKHKYMPTNCCELSDCSPLPNFDHTADDTSPAVKPYYFDQRRLPSRIMQRIVLPALAERLRFQGMLVTTLSAWTPHTRLEARQWRQAYRDSLNALEQAAYDEKIKALALAYLKAWRKLRGELIGPVEYWKRPDIKPTDAEIITLSAQGHTAEEIHRRLRVAASTVIRAEHRQGWLRPPPQTKQIVDPEHLNPDDDWKLHNGKLHSYMAYDENDKPLFAKPQKLYGRGRHDAANLLRSGAADRLEVTVCGKTSAHEAVTHEDKLRLVELIEKDKKQSSNGQRSTTPADTYRAGQTVKYIGDLVLDHAQRFGVDTVGTIAGNIERINDYVIGGQTAPYTPVQGVHSVDTPPQLVGGSEKSTPIEGVGIEHAPLAAIHPPDTAPCEADRNPIACADVSFPLAVTQNTPSAIAEDKTVHEVPEHEIEPIAPIGKPSSKRPTIGETRTYNGITLVYDGRAWRDDRPVSEKLAGLPVCGSAQPEATDAPLFASTAAD